MLRSVQSAEALDCSIEDPKFKTIWKEPMASLAFATMTNKMMMMTLDPKPRTLNPMMMRIQSCGEEEHDEQHAWQDRPGPRTHVGGCQN